MTISINEIINILNIKEEDNIRNTCTNVRNLYLHKITITEVESECIIAIVKDNYDISKNLIKS